MGIKKYLLALLLFMVIAKPTAPKLNKPVVQASANKTAAVQHIKAETAAVKPPDVKPTAPVAEERPPEPQVTVAAPLTDKEQLMQQAGIPQSDWGATDYIVTHESNWNPVDRNPSSGAYGLCQALPASKMASVGGDYLTNPVTQLKWCHQYALNRYGSWWASFAFWRANRWW